MGRRERQSIESKSRGLSERRHRCRRFLSSASLNNFKIVLNLIFLLFPLIGNYSLRGKGAPLMNKIYLESSKKIANPSASEVAEGRPTVFDTWVHRYPDFDHPTKPW